MTFRAGRNVRFALAVLSMLLVAASCSGHAKVNLRVRSGGRQLVSPKASVPSPTKTSTAARTSTGAPRTTASAKTAAVPHPTTAPGGSPKPKVTRPPFLSPPPNCGSCPVTTDHNPSTDLYIGETPGNGQLEITRIPADGSAQQPLILPGHSDGLMSLAADSKGNVYWNSWSTSNIYREAMNGSGGAVVAGGCSWINGIAVDLKTDIFYTSQDCTGASEATAQGQYQDVKGSQCDGFNPPAECGAQSPRGITVAKDGTVFFVDNQGSRIVEVPGNGGPQSDLVTGLNDPRNVAVDPGGDVFFTSANGLSAVLAGTHTVKQIAAFGKVGAIAVDGAGNLYVVDLDHHRVAEVTNGKITTILSDVSDVGQLAVRPWA